MAGVDEAGRGPLAGPVVAAAVVFDRSYLEKETGETLAGLDDSKKLSARRRAGFFDLLTSSSEVQVGIACVDEATIDALNILHATHLAMRKALADLERPADHALVDGRPVAGLPCGSTAVVGGDGRSLSIAAASVVAKVTRDRLMLDLDAQYPEYGFARHKGYGTREHLEALRRLGPAPCHRRSFGPVCQLDLGLSP